MKAWHYTVHSMRIFNVNWLVCQEQFSHKLYSAYQKKKVIHIQRPIVLKSIDLKICVWHISKEQLILFPLVHFVHQVCHAWPSTLPLKMTMSWPTFCKFGQLDKSVIAKQCNGVAAEIVSSHARWSFPFWKIVITRCLQLLLVLLRIVQAYLTWISGYLGIYLAMVGQDLQDILHCCHVCVEIRGGYVEDVGA